MVRPIFFLPSALKSALDHESAQSLTVTDAQITIDGFTVMGFGLTGSRANLEAFVRTATLDFGMQVNDGARIHLESVKEKRRGDKPKVTVTERPSGS